MGKRNKFLITNALIIVIMAGSCFRILSGGSIRTVEFISVLALGILLGAFLTQLFLTKRNKNS